MASKWVKDAKRSVRAACLLVFGITALGEGSLGGLSDTKPTAWRATAIEVQLADTAGSRTLHVCAQPSASGQCQFDSLADAIGSARPGDTVLLAPGVYREAVVVLVSGLTIRGEPGAHLTGAAAEGKAALVVRADGVTIEGIECSGIQVRDRNGACVRIEGRDLVIRDVYFHDNQEGVLGGKGGSVIIENSRFERNGFNQGFSHSVYITSVDRFIFRNNRVLSTKDEGQGVKSRAKKTIIENNVIASLDSRDSRAIDIPNGGEVIIRNNILQKGFNSSNSQMIGLGLEGNLHPAGSAMVENNVLLFDRDLPRVVEAIDEIVEVVSKPGTAIYNKMNGEVILRNNTIVGAGQLEIGEDVLKIDNALHRNRGQAGLAAAPTLPEPPGLGAD